MQGFWLSIVRFVVEGILQCIHLNLKFLYVQVSP